MIKKGTIFQWNHSDPDNQGQWMALETPQTDGLFTPSFLARHLATGEESYIGPDGSEIEIVVEAIKPGDLIRFDQDNHSIVTRAMLDRDHDRGVFVRRFEPSGQPYEMWVTESRINGLAS